MENIERPAEVTKAQAQVMTEKNQQKYDQDQFEKIYDYLDELNGEASGNVKQVTVSQTQTSGVEIGKIAVDGQETKLYAPQQTAVDLQMVSHTFSQTIGSAGTVAWKEQTISKSGYKPVGIVGHGQATVGFFIVDGDIYLSASSNGSGKIRARVKNDANGATTSVSIPVYVLWIKI